MGVFNFLRLFLVLSLATSASLALPYRPNHRPDDRQGHGSAHHITAGKKESIFEEVPPTPKHFGFLFEEEDYNDDVITSSNSGLLGSSGSSGPIGLLGSSGPLSSFGSTGPIGSFGSSSSLGSFGSPGLLGSIGSSAPIGLFNPASGPVRPSGPLGILGLGSSGVLNPDLQEEDDLEFGLLERIRTLISSLRVVFRILSSQSAQNLLAFLGGEGREGDISLDSIEARLNDELSSSLNLADDKIVSSDILRNRRKRHANPSIRISEKSSSRPEDLSNASNKPSSSSLYAVHEVIDDDTLPPDRPSTAISGPEGHLDIRKQQYVPVKSPSSDPPFSPPLESDLQITSPPNLHHGPPLSYSGSAYNEATPPKYFSSHPHFHLPKVSPPNYFYPHHGSRPYYPTYYG